jgi:hypothetical protein
MVEFGSTYFKRMGWTISKCIRKVKDLFFVATVADRKVCAVLGHANLPDFVKDAEAIQDWQIHWKQRLANMKARMRIFLQEYDLVAPFLKESADRRSGRSAAYYDYIGLNFRHVLSDRILAN